jgi:pyruvate dehydrogenase E2 component (dihydrolipoamide acetyltransferase)
MVELTVPDLGGFGEVPVIEILVQPGERIEKDAPLVTLESDKATMEVPASEGGVVKDIRVKLGDKVSQGSVLATIEPAAVAQSAPAAAPPSLRSDTAGIVAADAGATEEAASPPAPPAAVASSASLSAPLSAPHRPPSNGMANGTASAAAAGNGGAAVHAAPGLRRFARELGVDLHHVRGSGPNGRITREDVQHYVKSTLAAPAQHAPASAGAPSGLGLGLPPWPSVDFAKYGPVERVPLTRIQRISGPALARNWVMIPHVTQNEDADVTDLETFRKTVNAEQKDVKVTMLAFLIKASVAALKQYPIFNASLDGAELVLKRYYAIGFAADTPQGLVVPVIRDADTKGLVQIARESAQLAAKARDGKLTPDEMSGATFTISSLGSIGGTTFTPIINAPEVAILGAARADIRPVWDGGQFVPRLIQPLSLSYDHRVIDGANAARFVVALKASLGDLRRTLL